MDFSSLHPPRVLHPSVYQSGVDYPSPTDSQPSVTHRSRSATGTRKHITLDSLLPLDAPIQSRKYVTPSATSRKDAFSNLRNVPGVDLDELADDSHGHSVGELHQLEWKRRQNTLAARKSRQRKLQHQLELEEAVRSLSTEKESWKARALMYEALLRSNGINVPELT